MSHVAYTTTSGHGSVSSKGILAFVMKLPEWIAKRSQLRAAERYLRHRPHPRRNPRRRLGRAQRALRLLCTTSVDQSSCRERCATARPRDM
jgi:hypothetical protein